MAYQSLQRLFYMDKSNERFTKFAALAESRRITDSAFRTGIQSRHGEFFLAVPRELSLLSETVLRCERRVSALTRDLPPIAYYSLVRELVVSEVVSTNEMEGVHSSRRQVLDALEGSTARNKGRHIPRFGEFARLYFNLTEPDPLVPTTPEDVRKIYDMVMLGEDIGDDAPDGKLFRKGKEAVYRDASTVVHEGLHPESAITDAIRSMLLLVNSDDVPKLYSAMLGHFIFEYIHPFYDGNGRTGRYLLALWLSEPLSVLTSLSLSRIILENKSTYYRSFRETERERMYGELTFFVLQMLRFVREAQDDLEESLVQKRNALDTAHAGLSRLAQEQDICEAEFQILYMLAQDGLFASDVGVKLRDVANYIRLGTQTARKHTLALAEKGLIDEVSHKPLRFALSNPARTLLALDSDM